MNVEGSNPKFYNNREAYKKAYKEAGGVLPTKKEEAFLSLKRDLSFAGIQADRLILVSIFVNMAEQASYGDVAGLLCHMPVLGCGTLIPDPL